MSDIIQETFAAFYPYVTAIVSGAGGYWITTQLFPEASRNAAGLVAMIVAIVVLAEVAENE